MNFILKSRLRLLNTPVEWHSVKSYMNMSFIIRLTAVYSNLTHLKLEKKEKEKNPWLF